MTWTIAEINFKNAFLQTADSEIDVYFVPTREFKNRCFYWLLFNSAYSLVNSNSKWQEHCNHLFVDIKRINLSLSPIFLRQYRIKS